MRGGAQGGAYFPRFEVEVVRRWEAARGNFKKRMGLGVLAQGLEPGLWGLLGRVIEGVQLTKWEWLTGGRGSGWGH